jgi:hypothetical protein
MQITNIKQLRESLTDNYEKIKDKRMPLNIAKELANTAGKIINSCKVELEYNALLKNDKAEIDFLKNEDKSA